MTSKLLTKGIRALLLSTIMIVGMVPGTIMNGFDLPTEVKAASLTNPTIVVDSSMKSKQKVTWNCIWFGSYPQTEIVDRPSTSGVYGKEWEKASDYVVNETLYTKLKNSTYDAKGDTEIDGTKYRRIQMSDVHYTEEYPTYYNWYNSIQYHYFRIEPIKWRVLNVENNKALLLADVGLNQSQYYIYEQREEEEEEEEEFWQYERPETTWENSYVRNWLNGYDPSIKDSFANDAFNSSEKNSILVSDVVNGTITYGGGSYYDEEDDYYYERPVEIVDTGNDTKDQVFLLSKDEVSDTETAKKYGFVSDLNVDDEGRVCLTSTYAKAMGVSNGTNWDGMSSKEIGYCSWWLRTSDRESDRAYQVLNDGHVEDYYVNSRYYAVRPALNLNLTDTSIWKYAGTVCSDGSVNEVNNPNGHTHTIVNDSAVAATCTATGKTAGEHCSVCNAIIVAQTTTSALGHNWNTGTITTQPTFTTNGVKTYTCNRCGGTKTEPVPKLLPIKVSGIKLSGISKKISAGRKIQLAATILPANVTNNSVTWTTSKKSYATVSSQGLVTINKKAGGKSVVVTATAQDGSGVKATYKISCMKGIVKSVKITGAKPVKAGKSIKLAGKVTATKGANKTLKWTSNNTKYATVSGSGKVTAKAAGKGKSVKITAMATDGSGKKKTVTIKIK